MPDKTLKKSVVFEEKQEGLGGSASSTKRPNFLKKFIGRLVKLPPKKKAALATGLIVALLVATGATFVAAAGGMGRGYVWSHLARFLQVEKISVLDSFRKSDEELVRDALAGELNIETIKALGGRELAMSMEVTAETAKSTDFPATVTFKMAGTSEIAADGETAKGSYSLGGKIDAGLFSFDAGEKALQIDVLAPKKNEYYVKFKLSSEIKNLLSLGSAAYGLSASPYVDEIENYLDKYYFIDPYEYQIMTAETSRRGSAVELPPLDVEKAKDAGERFYEEFTPDAQKYVRNMSMKLIENSELTTLPRQEVSGIPAIGFEMDVDNDKIPSLSKDAIVEMLALLKYHRNAYVAYCESVRYPDVYQPDCSEEFDQFEDAYDELTGDKEGEVTKAFDEVFDYLVVKDIKVYINPVDGTLLSAEFTISLSSKALLESGLDKMDITFSYAEVSRGKKVDIEVPEGAPNLTDELRKAFEASPSTLVY